MISSDDGQVDEPRRASKAGGLASPERRAMTVRGRVIDQEWTSSDVGLRESMLRNRTREGCETPSRSANGQGREVRRTSRVGFGEGPRGVRNRQSAGCYRVLGVLDLLRRSCSNSVCGVDPGSSRDFAIRVRRSARVEVRFLVSDRTARMEPLRVSNAADMFTLDLELCKIE